MNYITIDERRAIHETIRQLDAEFKTDEEIAAVIKRSVWFVRNERKKFSYGQAPYAPPNRQTTWLQSCTQQPARYTSREEAGLGPRER
jgi:hypothetical protein